MPSLSLYSVIDEMVMTEELKRLKENIQDVKMFGEKKQKNELLLFFDIECICNLDNIRILWSR